MIDNIDKYVAKKLKYYRVKFDWPLKKLADDLGVSLQQMHRYEQGTNKISAGLLYRLSKIFKIDITCFFDNFEESTIESKDDSYKVLLIEDNPDDEYFFRKCIAEFDEHLDIYVLRDGTEVLNYFRELQDTSVRLFSQPDIIFMDLNIPSANGFELLNDLKKRPVLNGVPIIVLTSSVNEEDASKSYLLHANGFIRKSFTFKEYSEQLNIALNYWIKAAGLPHHEQMKELA
ncbi:MAG: response regulator [Candidatus Paracaedibacteraceae bacterium]|nr:response regulator [Candidatus Paracaedibacteraceae bacterium]